MSHVPDPGRMIAARDILSAADVRRLSGGISRHTLINWRATKGFPAPMRAIKQRRGRDLELWDRRDVKAWLRANPPVE